MARTWYPILNKDTCVDWGTCMEFCPHGVYSTNGDGSIVVVSPIDCVEFCQGCAKICPTESISYFGDE